MRRLTKASFAGSTRSAGASRRPLSGSAGRPPSARSNGSGAPSITRSARGLCLALALAAAGLLALAATPAWGAYLHTNVTGEYGKEGPKSTGVGSGCRLAYQAANHLLYLFSDGKIYGLDRTAPGTVTPLGGGFPITTGIGSSCGDPDMDVDNSGGGSAGNLYAVPSSTSIYGWNASGGALGAPWPVSAEGETCGVAVTNTGEVWGGTYGKQRVTKFTAAGAANGSISIGYSFCKLAVDQVNNDLYVQPYSSAGVKKYTAASGYTSSLTFPESGNSNAGLAVNHAQHRLYVGNGSSQVKAYDTETGSLLETINIGANGGRGIAVDEATDTLFVTVGSGSSGVIKEISGVVVPDITTGEPIGNSGVSGHVDPAGGGEVTECYFEFGLTTSYGSTAPCTPSAPFGTAQDVTANLPGLLGEKTYHYRLVAANANGKNVGGDKTITPHNVQGLKTEEATNIARTTATLNASFEGNGELTHYYFEWGPTAAYGSISKEAPGESAGSPTYPPLTYVHFDVTGLEPETTYHFRVVAENGEGISEGKDKTFTTLPAVPGLLTTAATEIGQDTVTLNGELAGNGEETHYYFEYGLTTDYGMVSEAPPGTKLEGPSGPTPVSSKITEYEAYETYHYRIVASNAVGTTYGNDQTFTAEPAPLPEIANTSASDVTDTSAMLEAEINPNRWLTVYAFEYGPTAAYGSSTVISGPIGSDKAMHAVSALVSDLSPRTIYHFRVVAINFTGTAWGPDQTLITPGPPSVNLTFSSGLGQTTAHIGAQVSANSAATKVYFEYGTSTAYGQSTAEVSIGPDAGVHEVGADLSGLSAGTTYHFRVIATNAFGTAKGADRTFAIAPASTVTPPPPKKCRKGFVRRHGKCVKKPRKHRKHRRHSTRRRG